MGEDLYAVNGETPDQVEIQENTPGHMTPIVTVQPERGHWLRFLNSVAKGEEAGLPLYQKLFDQNGDPMPATTKLVIKARGSQMTEAVKVSELLRTISYYNQHSIKEQRNEESVDGAKIELEWPENSSKTGTRPHIDITDLEELQVCIESPQVIDTSLLELYFDSNAIEQYSKGGQ